jgi:uncharacterized protein YutE (UPF0331/DUF86 family)
VPQSSKDIFALLAQAGCVSADLAQKMQRMVGYRNVAVHDYQVLQLPITVAVITGHLDEFLDFSQAALRFNPPQAPL